MKPSGKRKLSLLLVLILCLSLISPLTGIYADSEGEEAYLYMETMADMFPARWAETPILVSCREWLLSIIRSIGYEDVQTVYCQGVSPLGWKNGEMYSGQNIEFVKPGDSEREVIVCAHFDGTDSAGADDNGSGVGALLEIAHRMRHVQTPYTIRFILFNLEEQGYVGSSCYVRNMPKDQIADTLAVINLDSIAAGDNMYAYGGAYENGELVRTWVLDQAMATAEALGITLSYHPDVNAAYPVPTKIDGSDQTPFNAIGIPYVYFEASNWNGGSFDNFYQTSDPAVANGKIMHVVDYDQMPFLKAHFDQRMKEHLRDYVRITCSLLSTMQQPIPAPPETEPPQTEPVETQPPQTEPVTTEALPTEAPETEPATEELIPVTLPAEGETEEESPSTEESESQTPAPTETETEAPETTALPTTSPAPTAGERRDFSGDELPEYGSNTPTSSKGNVAAETDAPNILAFLIIGVLGALVLFIIATVVLYVVNRNRAARRRRKH